MEFKHKAKMAIEDFRKYVEDDDYEFAYATVDFLSNKPNSHMHKYSEDVIKKYAPSVLGKWVVGEYDGYDMTTHTSNQVIHGIVPPNQEVKYRYDDDGFLIASVDVVLSKLYSDAYKVLRDDNFRSVSIEELLGFTPETEEFEDGVQEKEVVGFNVCGITILGKFISPSIPNANIKITQMSELDIDKAELAYAKYSEVKPTDNNNTMSEILSKLSKIEEKLNKEEHMSKDITITKYAVSIGDDLWSRLYSVLKEQYPVVDGDWVTCKYWIKGIYEDGTEKFAILEERDGVKLFKVMFTLTEQELTLSEELVEVVKDFVEVNKMEMFTKDEVSKYEDDMKETKDEPMEDEEPKVEIEVSENACGEDKAKMSELEDKIASYEKEIAELKEFKMEVLNERKGSVVEATMSKIKDLIDADTFSKYESSGKSCKYEDINGWKNEVMAEISDLALSKLSSIDKQDNSAMDMGIVGTVVKQSKHKTCYDL